MKYKAVIFDLFGTLVDNLSVREYENVLRQMASVLSAPSDDFIRLWFDTFDERATGVFGGPEENIKYVCRKLEVDLDDCQIKPAAQIRFNFTARSMIPRADAIETLSYIKSAGYQTGLITDCSVETPTLWQGTPLAPLIDVAVFSCLVGLKKPNPRIYQIVINKLAVEPEDCLYVGDGASQELTGSAQVGMHPILIRVPYEDSDDTHRLDREGWNGPVISSLMEIVPLLD